MYYDSWIYIPDTKLHTGTVPLQLYVFCCPVQIHDSNHTHLCRFMTVTTPTNAHPDCKKKPSILEMEALQGERTVL